jgi:hypothetical protein
MKQWFKLRYRLSNGGSNITEVFIDVKALGDDLEEAIRVGKPALLTLFKIPAERDDVLKLIGVYQ